MTEEAPVNLTQVRRWGRQDARLYGHLEAQDASPVEWRPLGGNVEGAVQTHPLRTTPGPPPHVGSKKTQNFQ